MNIFRLSLFVFVALTLFGAGCFRRSAPPRPSITVTSPTPEAVDQSAVTSVQDGKGKIVR